MWHYPLHDPHVLPREGVLTVTASRRQNAQLLTSQELRQSLLPNIIPPPYGDESKPWYLVNPKIAGIKWMFIPQKMYL